MRKIIGIILGSVALVAIVGTAPVSAQNASQKLMKEIKDKVKDPKAAKIIHDRRMLMRSNIANMKQIAGYAKTGEGNPKTVAAAARRISQNAGKIPSVIVADTGNDKYPGATKLLPSAYGNSAKIEQYAKSLAAAADNMVKVASAKGADRKSIGAAVGAMGKECGGCHNDFRAK